MQTYMATPDYYSCYIFHYGVKGMHWGIRKKIDTGVSKGGSKIAGIALKKRSKKNAKGKWLAPTGSNNTIGNRLRAHNNKKFTKSKRWRHEDNAQKAGENIVKNMGKTAAISVGASVATFAAAKAVSKKIFTAVGGKELGKAFAKGTKISPAKVAADAAVLSLGVGAIETYRYSKYGAIRTKRNKANKGK